MQDSRGFIWMGTDGSGVTRFDGNTFETFGKVNGLSGNVVRCLLEDSKGNIWMGTNNGITVYDGYSLRKIGKEDGLGGSSVLKIIEAANHNILAATNDGGLSVLIPGDSLKIKNFTAADGLVSDFIFDIYEDEEGMFWLAMIGGVDIIEFSDSTTIKQIYEPEINYSSIVSFTSIEPGNDGEIWLGSYENGLFKVPSSKDKNNIVAEPSPVNSVIGGMTIWDLVLKKNGELLLATNEHGVVTCMNDRIISDFNTTSGLSSNQIMNILVDREGNTWFASFGQGAMLYSGNKLLSYTQDDGLKGLQVLGIRFTPDGYLFVATEEGLLKFRKNGDKIERVEHFAMSNGLMAAGANALAEADDMLWIGTTNGLYTLKNSTLSEFAGNRSLENKNINSLAISKNNNIWIGTVGGFGRVFGDSLFFMNEEKELINNEVQTIIEDRKGRIWMGTLGGLVMIEDNTYRDFNEEDGLTVTEINALAEDPSGNILIGTTGGGIFKFDVSVDSSQILQYTARGVLGSNTVTSLMFVNDSTLIAGNDKGFDLIITGRDQNIRRVIHNTLDDGFTGGGNNPNSIAQDNDGMVWFGTKNGLVRYDISKDMEVRNSPRPYISGIRLFYEDVDWKSRDISTKRFTNLPENLTLSHRDNHLTFLYTGLSYLSPEEDEFSYILENRNQSKEWSPYTRERDILFSGLTPGNYTFKVKAKNKFGLEGDTAEYSFVIRPPFWKTAWFLVPSFILFIVLLLVMMRFRERNLIEEKLKLEKIVDERTREVVEQRNEIAKQRDVVLYQKKEITDSIQYAERIQKAVLPVENILKDHVSDYFILFRPKDIVSGDFYWMAEKSGNIIFTAADCTGHGVPGAFMSMLGVSFLNKIVNEEGTARPSLILDSLRKEIIASLKQEGGFDTNKDGMDIALCSVDLNSMTLQFAGANNPMALVRKENGEFTVIQIKGDKMPIGFHSRMDEFTNHTMELRKGDTIYLASDGYEDQFGGPDGKKFMKARLNRMLSENQHL
ncbi:MAG: two-component regulator propeller domain-containing protein, partial [Chloroflexota bacterium]